MQNLTPGCLANSLNLIPLSSASYLQCLGLKIIQPKIPGGPIRHRLMVSDGLNSLNVMLSSNIADLADNGAIQEGTIVRVNEFMHNEAGGKRVLIVLSMDVVGHHAGIIGDPKPLDPSQAIAAPPAALNSATMPLTAVGPGPTYGGNVPSSNYAPHGQAGIPHSSAYSTHPPNNLNSYQNPIAVHQTSFGGQQTHGGLQTSNAQTMGMNNNYTDSRMPVPVMNAVTGGSRPVPPPHYGAGSGAVARNEAPARIMPIRSLNPFSGRWTIKAKCTSKAEMKRWSNQKSEGKLFSFDLLDAQGGEIRVTAFNDQVDKFYDLVEVGKVYLVSKASLKHKKPQFNATNHDYEISLDRESIVELCPMDEEALSIPDVLFNFRPIADIGTVEAGAILDVIGVVESVENWQTLTRKTGEETRKRALVLRDSSGGSIELTLWGQAVSDPGESLYTMVQAGQRPILAVKNARVGDFNGKTLGTVGSSTLKVQPEIQEAMHLAQWYSAGGASVQAQALSGVSKGGMMGDRRCTLSAIKDEDLGHGEKPDYIVVHATINYVKSDSFPGYASCPGDFNGRLCQKKLTEGGGQWYCERCSKYYSEPVWRYIVSIQASDHTAQSWLTCFGDAGELLMNGVKAPELKQMEMENLQEYEKMMMDANLNRMVFKLKVAEESYNDEVRVKVSVTKLEHMDYIKESRATLDLIHKLEAGVPIFQPKSLEAMPGSTTSMHHSHHAFQQPQNLHGGGGMQFAGNGASPGPYSMGQQGTAGYQQHGGSSVSTATYQAGHMGHPMQQHTSSAYGARQPQFEDQVVSHQPYGVNNAQNSIRHMQGGVMGAAPSGPPAYLQHQRYDASGPQQHSLHGGMPQGRDTADYGHDIGRPMGVSHSGPPGSGMPGYDGSGASYLSRAPQQDHGNNFPSGGFNMPGNAATDHGGLPAQQTAGAYGTTVSGQQPQQRGSVPPFW